MNEIFFKVQKQTITCTKRSVIADGQSDWVKMNFDFSDDWNDLDKTVQVTQGEEDSSASKNASNSGCCCSFHGKGRRSSALGETYSIHLGKTGTWCYLPAEIEEGSAKISVFGYETDAEEAVRATTVPCKIYIKKSGFVSDGKTPIPPTKDLYQQIVEELDEKAAGIQDGADGDSAYQIAVKNGFTGTEQEWLASLKGTDGKDGRDGVNGQNGADGFSPRASIAQTETGAIITVTDATGTTTAEVQNGKSGEKGDKGDKGDAGERGLQGEKGSKGDPGKDGTSPTAKITQTETGAVFTVTDATGTTTATLTNGKDGAKGDKGDQGEKGDTGKTGETGAAGKDGENGKDGKDGTSPTASVTQTATGATITVTDASGTTTATLTNGKDGEKGEDGAKGEDGKDGTSPTIEVYANTSTTYQLKITTADGSFITPNLKGAASGTATEKVMFYDSGSYIDYANAIFVYNSYRASQNLDTPETLEGTVGNNEEVVDAGKNININQNDFGWAGLGLIMSMSPETVKSSEMMLQTAKINGTADEKIYFIPPSLVTEPNINLAAKEIADYLTAETLDESIIVVDNPLLHTGSGFLTWAVNLSDVPDGDYYVVLSAHSDNSKPIFKAIWIQE